jgi:hypothetical protein
MTQMMIYVSLYSIYIVLLTSTPLAVALKETPKPEIMHIEDDEEYFEGGGSDTKSDQNTSSKKRKRIAKNNTNSDILAKKSKRLKGYDESSVEINSSDD